jgi:tripartite-type tricarboxylate transporter receptor subunit TctC
VVFREGYAPTHESRAHSIPWYGFLVPKGTPESIRRKLYDQLVEILKKPEIVARLRDFGAEPGGQAPEQFAAFIHAETEKWMKVAKEAGISPE